MLVPMSVSRTPIQNSSATTSTSKVYSTCPLAIFFPQEFLYQIHVAHSVIFSKLVVGYWAQPSNQDAASEIEAKP